MQTSMNFPGLGGVVTVGNKLFKSNTIVSSPSRTDSKVSKRRRSRERKNGLFASNVKQAKIDIERYSTENNRAINNSFDLNPTIDTSLKKDSDLVIID